MIKLPRWVPGLALVPAMAIGMAGAHEGAEGVVLERMEVMKSMAGEAKSLSEMLTGKTPFDTATAADAARAITAHSQEIPDLFPAGSGGGPSKAKEEVWDDRVVFERRAALLGENAEDLEVAIEAGRDVQQLMPLFRSVTASCQACHETFRSN